MNLLEKPLHMRRARYALASYSVNPKIFIKIKEKNISKEDFCNIPSFL